MEGLNVELSKVGNATIENAWAQVTPAQSVAAPVDNPYGSAAIQYDERGSVVNAKHLQVQEKGVQPGTRLQRQEEDETLSTVEVVSIGRDGSIVAFRVAEDGSLTRSSVTWDVGQVLGSELTTWRAEYMDNWRSLCPSANDAYRLSLCKSYVTKAIDDVGSSVGNLAVKVQTKPQKRLLADVEYKKDSLVLVCQSLKPTVVRKGEKIPKAALEVVLPEKLSNDFVAYVVPTNGDTFFCPAWHARAAADNQKPNVVLSHIDGVPVYRNSIDAIKRGEEILLPQVDAKESQLKTPLVGQASVGTATDGAAADGAAGSRSRGKAKSKGQTAPKEPPAKHPRRR